MYQKIFANILKISFYVIYKISFRFLKDIFLSIWIIILRYSTYCLTFLITNVFYLYIHLCRFRFYDRVSGKRDIKKPKKLLSTESENDDKVKKIKNKSPIKTSIKKIKEYLDENKSPNIMSKTKISAKPKIISDEVVTPASSIKYQNETQRNKNTEFFVSKQITTNAKDEFNNEESTRHIGFNCVPSTNIFVSNSVQEGSNFLTYGQKEKTTSEVYGYSRKSEINYTSNDSSEQNSSNNQAARQGGQSHEPKYLLNHNHVEPINSDLSSSKVLENLCKTVHI